MRLGVVLSPTARYEFAATAPEAQAEVERRVATGEIVSAEQVKGYE
jgi:hypothetical protein